MLWRLPKGGRGGEIKFLGEVENQPGPIGKLIKKLAGRCPKLHVCFEAGPTGYGLHRQIQGLGHDCLVVAPSLILPGGGHRTAATATARRR